MIELYKLQWSHYVEKVILALEFKGIPWHGIDVDAFSKKEMRHFDARQYVPLINDTERGVALSDSSRILEYLDARFPQEPRLFPSEAGGIEKIYPWLVAMDSYLGLPARRIAYARMLIETPTIMADLFLPTLCGGIFNWPGVRHVSSAVVGMILTTRFRLHQNHDDEVREQLEGFLLKVVEKLEGRPYLFGPAITAADLTLAALLRPLRMSEFFRSHPKFSALFGHQERIFARFSRPLYRYEQIPRPVERSQEAPKIRRLETDSALSTRESFSFDLAEAINDQQPVYHWKFLLSPYHYLCLRAQAPI